ncbi:craniofacial development protein 2 [Biomphalaria glabrata]|nr:craniofacial development protein 2-like [Biomphalaria glabrata]
MNLKLPLQNERNTFPLLAVTMTNPDDVIAKFYEELNSTILDIPKTDHVITRQYDRQDIRVTKSCCGAECGTDHRLIITKLNIRIQPKNVPKI